MSVLSIRSRLTGIDNDAKDLIFQGIRNGQTVTMADVFAVDQYVRNIKRNDAWKNISFFRDFSLIPNLNPAGGPRITFTRASSATRVNQQGVIETVSTNVPRFDYDPATGAAKGLLIEEARTNLVLRSNEFSNAVWISSGITISSVSSTDPAGNSTSFRALISSGGSQGTRTFQQTYTGSVASTTFTFSIYVKSNTGASQTFALKLTQAGVADNFSSNLTATSDWQKFSFTKTFIAGGTGAIVGIVCDSLNNSSDLLIYGAQLEAGSFPTSYIPTTSATVTRGADLASISGVFFDSIYNKIENGFLVQCSVTNLATYPVIGFSGGTDNGTRLQMQNNNNLIQTLRDSVNGAADYGLGVTYVQSGKFASMFKASDYSLCLNGGTVATSSNTWMINPSSILLGSTSASAYLNGYISRFIYFRKKLTNSAIQSITSS